MRMPGRRVGILSIPVLAVATLVFATHGSLLGQSSSPAAKKIAAVEPVPATTPFVEEHAHFDEKDPAGSVRAAVAALGRENAAMILFQISPDTFDHPGRYDSEIILAEVKKHNGKLALTGGGGSLNAMIMQAVSTGDAGPEVQKKFKARAEELLRKGVIGFGEMTAEHFDGFTPYQSAPPDHPLFLLLSDLAAEHSVPIDIHMEAVPQDMALPSDLKSPPNAARLHANIAAFERLLRIIRERMSYGRTSDRISRDFERWNSTVACCRRIQTCIWKSKRIREPRGRITRSATMVRSRRTG